MRPTRPGIYTPKGADVYKGKSAFTRIGQFLGGAGVIWLALVVGGDPEVSGWLTLIMVVMGLASIGASFDSHEKV